MKITIDNFSIAPILEKDAWRLCDFVVANEPGLRDYFPETLRSNSTPSLAELFVQQKARAFATKDEYLFSIKENTNRSIIGLIYVKDLHKKPGRAELAYAIGYPHQGKGLMPKFLMAIIEWAFSTGGLSTLQAIVHKDNDRSKRVVEKTNFQFCTILKKEHRMADGRIADMQLYELEKKDWQKQQ